MQLATLAVPSSARLQDMYQNLKSCERWDLQLSACSLGWPSENLVFMILLGFSPDQQSIHKNNPPPSDVDCVASLFMFEIGCLFIKHYSPTVVN